MNEKHPKPILKWVGGKTQILDKLLPEFPSEIKNYREIFLGGGSVLFALLSYVNAGKITVKGNIYAYDLNEELIYVYKNIQTNHLMLYDEIQKLLEEFNSCETSTEINRKAQTLLEAKQCRENYYYWSREKYNKLADKKTVVGSALFIFLNKTCFRGVFRIGPNGFNVPYGNYAKPEIVNKTHLEEIHCLIQGVLFECVDFSQSMNSVEDGDFVYLDPPYAPETITSFVGYTKGGFNEHAHLFEICRSLSSKFMMSNADVKLVRDNFAEEKYELKSVICKRSINSKNPDAKAKEVIIKNY